MDAIKQIIVALAGEDISPANREKIISLTEKLREALREWQKADLPGFDRVSIVLPDGFAPVAPQTAIHAPVVNTTHLQKPQAAPKPMTTTIAAVPSISFAAPRPPATIRVSDAEPVLETIGAETSVVEATMVWDLQQPSLQEALPQALPTEPIVPEIGLSTLAPDIPPRETDDVAVPAIEGEVSEVPSASLPPAMQMLEALMNDLPLTPLPLLPDDHEPLQPLELTIDQEMLEEQMALEADHEPSEATKPQTTNPSSHTPYLPKSMQLEHVEDLMVLPKPKPVAPARAMEAAPQTQTVEVNERLQTRRRELSDVLQEPRIADLRKGISINERYQYIQNLFRADEAMFERSIKTLNSFNILAEAQYWMQRELVIKLGWNDEDELVQQFYQLVSRRFRSI